MHYTTRTAPHTHTHIMHIHTYYTPTLHIHTARHTYTPHILHTHHCTTHTYHTLHHIHTIHEHTHHTSALTRTHIDTPHHACTYQHTAHAPLHTSYHHNTPHTSHTTSPHTTSPHTTSPHTTSPHSTSPHTAPHVSTFFTFTNYVDGMCNTHKKAPPHTLPQNPTITKKSHHHQQKATSRKFAKNFTKKFRKKISRKMGNCLFCFCVVWKCRFPKRRTQYQQYLHPLRSWQNLKGLKDGTCNTTQCARFKNDLHPLRRSLQNLKILCKTCVGGIVVVVFFAFVSFGEILHPLSSWKKLKMFKGGISKGLHPLRSGKIWKDSRTAHATSTMVGEQLTNQKKSVTSR